MQLPGTLLYPCSKNKKINTEKNSLYFRKWNFLTLRLKNFLYFLKRKLFWYFRKWNPSIFKPSSKNKIIIIITIIHPKGISYTIVLKNFLYFSKWKPSKKIIFSQKNDFLVFWETETPKKNSLYFWKRNFLIFQKTETLKNF